MNTPTLTIIRIGFAWLIMGVLAGFIPAMFMPVEHGLELFLIFGTCLGFAGAITNVSFVIRSPRDSENWLAIGIICSAVCAAVLGAWSVVAAENLWSFVETLLYSFIAALVPANAIAFILHRLQTRVWNSQ